MTAAHGQASRSPGVAPSLRASAIGSLVLLLVAGLALRLALAYVLLPGSGFETDLASFTGWANKLARDGADDFYATVTFADYPPAYLYVLWVVGALGQMLAPLTNADPGAVTAALIKVPPILLDICVGFLLYRVVRSWRGRRPDAHVLGLGAAGLYLFNPVTWYDSAVWGQTDAAGALVTLLTVAALVRGNSEGATVLAVLAALIKPQFGILLLPVTGVVLLRRHLLRPGSGPRNPVIAPAAIRRWFEAERGIWRLVSSAVAGLVVLLLLLAPFSLDIPRFLQEMAEAAEGYPWLSVNAYNPWALVGSNGIEPLVFTTEWSPDRVPLLGPLPGVVIGAALLLVGFAAGVARAAWHDSRRTIVVVTIFLALSFFMLPTRVHERYMFPIFALLPLLAVVDRRWLWATVVLSIAAFINFHGVLTTDLYATPNLERLPLGDVFRQPVGKLASIGLHILGYLFVIWQMRPAAALERDPYRAPGQRPPPEPAAFTSEPGTLSPESGSDLPTAAVPQPRWLAHERAWLEHSDEPQPEIEEWATPEPARPPSVVEAARGRVEAILLDPIRHRIAALLHAPSVRRDRSVLLIGETGGRLDRRDLFLVLLVFMAALLLRTYRLEVPYAMHFDEVYHARTGVEFLQHWRYDIKHSIYEFTHPHLAKYMMAAGIVTLGNNRVVDVRELGTPVTAAALEARWSPLHAPGERNGERLYVVTPQGVTAHDLAAGLAAGRPPVVTIPGAFVSVAVDEGRHVLYLGQADGTVLQLDTGLLDDLRIGGAPSAALSPQPFTLVSTVDGGLRALTVAANRLVAVSNGGTIVAFELDTAREVGRVTLDQPTAVAGVTLHNSVVVDTKLVEDRTALASQLGDLLDEDTGRIQGELARATGPITVAAYLAPDSVTEVQAQIDEGDLAGVTIGDGAGLAVGTADGVTIFDADTLSRLNDFDTPAPVDGLALAPLGPDKPTIYAASGNSLITIRLASDEAARQGETLRMPNTVERVLWNPGTTFVHVFGRAQDTTDPTVYVVEPRSNSVFADARLPAEPVALVFDVQRDRPAEDREDLLAIDSTGSVATIDVGGNGYAYRLPGVIAGAVLAACVFLLGRFLFRRRGVAIIAALLVLADGMFFSNARIAMNDTYVVTFIVAAMTLFVPLWLGRWRRGWAIAGGLLVVGVLLGLALASKWVAAYAIGGIGLLILLRSALGRLIALVAMVGLTGLLGYIAITPSSAVVSPQLNFAFLGLMIALCVLLAIGISVRPVRMTPEELRFAVAAPIALGAAVLGYVAYRAYRDDTPLDSLAESLINPVNPVLVVGGGLLALGLAVYLAASLAGRYGYGPRANLAARDPADEPAAPPPPRGWLRPGSGLLGLPWLLGLGAILVVPLAVYVVTYVPWIELGNRWLADFPAGNGGQTFFDLQRSMYDYHNYLRATHPASSPWWAWPLDLKPVWFEQTSYANNTTAVIYNTGNLVIFWLAIPAAAWVTWQAWQRRSLALCFVAIAIAVMWLPWARIDRATFQYHFLTTLPFSVLALAYFIAELWHGPSERTWLLARVGAALAIIGAPLLWLLRLPLCAIARTAQVNPSSEVCGPLTRELALTDFQAAGVLLAVGGLAAAGLLFLDRMTGGQPSTRRSLLLPFSFSTALIGGAIIIVGAGAGDPNRPPFFRLNVQAEYPALAALILLAIPAYFVLRSTDPRRFAITAVAAAVVWFVAFYPNFASLPVPAPLAHVHLGLLPTWNWGFQFGVNQDEPNRAALDLLSVGMLTVMIGVLCATAAWAARAWWGYRAEEPTVSAVPEAG